MQDQLLTTAELADWLRKPESWVYAQAHRLGIPRVKLGRQYRYPSAEVREWLGRQTERAA